jgi:3-methyladenine DNA glycosylase AlkD
MMRATAQEKTVQGLPTAEDIARKAIARMKSQADPEKAVQAQRYFKDAISSYGLSADDSRELAREVYLRVKGGWSLKEAVELCEILLPNKYLEAKGLATLVFLRFQKEFGLPILGLIKTWLARDYLDNWASVDLLCPDGLGGLLERYPGLVPKIKTWTAHPNRWVKRASAVAFIKLARRGKCLDAAYQIAARLFPCEDDLIEKANGWLLREAGKTDMVRLEKFLLRQRGRIPRTTLRYAIEKFPEPKRRRLLEKTRAQEK